MLHKRKNSPQAPRRNIIQRTERMLELPIGTLTSTARIEILDNRQITVEGCHGILEYENDTVRLNTASGILRLCGRNLEVQNLTEDTAVIGGYLLSVEFG